MPYLVVSMSRKFLLPGLLFILWSFPAFSQTGIEVVEAPRRLLLYFEQAGKSDFTASEMLMLYESLLLKLSRASEEVLIIEASEAGVPPSEEERSERAREWGVDSWLLARISGNMKAMTVAVISYDLISGEELFGFELVKEQGARLVDLERRFWDEVVEAVREKYQKVSHRIAMEGAGSAVVIFRAAPGTQIVGLVEEPLQIGPEREARVELPLHATYSWTAFCQGYYPVEQHIYLERGGTIINMEQRPGSRYALNFYLNNFTFPGFDFSYYFIPNFFFARVGLTSFLLGINLNNDSDSAGDAPILVSRSLLHLNLAAGLYLNEAHCFFRYYVAAGLFARIILARGYGIGVEPIAPFGIQPAFGVELSHQMRKRFYVEYSPLFYITGYPEWMRASFPSGRVPFNYIFLGKVVVDFFNFRIGLRLQL
ncbi:hypothetical protein ES703_107757 [subsurface metagenome]